MGRPTVLVVDNAENRVLACATLEDEGYAVLTAIDGEHAGRSVLR
jgi:CheY-like chemotaxis protein